MNNRKLWSANNGQCYAGDVWVTLGVLLAVPLLLVVLFCPSETPADDAASLGTWAFLGVFALVGLMLAVLRCPEKR